MPKKSSLKCKKSSCFGRKRKSSSKNDKKAVPGEIRIMMCVQDFSSRKIRKHPTWVRVPGVRSLEVDLIKQWYIKMQKARAIKIVFIHGMQNCIRVSYLDKIPTWFSHKITASSSDLQVNDYFNKAKRILTCMNYRDASAADADGGDWSVRGAGFLLTDKSANSEKRSQLKFKKYEDLIRECRYYGPQPRSVFHILDMINNNVDSIGNKAATKHLLCKEVVAVMKDQIELIMMGYPLEVLKHGGYINVAMAKAVAAGLPALVHSTGASGATPSSDNVAAATHELVQENTNLQKEVKTAQQQAEAAQQQAEAAKRTSTSLQKEVKRLSMYRGNVNEEKCFLEHKDRNGNVVEQIEISVQDLKSVAQLMFIANYETMNIDQLCTAVGEEFQRKHPKEKMSHILEQMPFLQMFATQPPSSTSASVRSSGGSAASSSASVAVAKSSATQSAKSRTELGAGAESGKDAIKAGKLAGTSFGRITGRGWSSGTTPMVGFVRPFRSTPMEAYTGMTPKMYASHINARTGTPAGPNNMGLAKANDYYGSYNLGKHMNFTNSFGRKYADSDSDSDSEDEKPKKRKAVAKKATKKKATKKSASTSFGKKKKRTSSSFGKSFFF